MIPLGSLCGLRSGLILGRLTDTSVLRWQAVWGLAGLWGPQWSGRDDWASLRVVSDPLADYPGSQSSRTARGQVLMGKCLSRACFLLLSSYCPKFRMWPSPESVWEGTVQGRRCRKKTPWALLQPVTSKTDYPHFTAQETVTSSLSKITQLVSEGERI